jgi:hypothetical protein
MDMCWNGHGTTVIPSRVSNGIIFFSLGPSKHIATKDATDLHHPILQNYGPSSSADQNTLKSLNNPKPNRIEEERHADQQNS